MVINSDVSNLEIIKEYIQLSSERQNNQTVSYRDYRTSLICKLFHLRREQIFRCVGGVPYPNVCERCEPDLFREEMKRFEQITLRRERSA